jgi:chromosome condensin MukBEF ATPase and DNA-binding subunit MukB
MKDDRGELDLTKQIEEKDKLIQELRMRIRDMLMISEQHRSILAEEIAKGKKLEKEVKDLKVQMSEYMSVRTNGAGSVS